MTASRAMWRVDRPVSPLMAEPAALIARAPGPMVTVQDRGRAGWRRFGVPASGAMDALALAEANALAGNAPDAAALEFRIYGGRFEAAAETLRLAIAGGDFAVEVDGRRVGARRSLLLTRGEIVSIGAAPDASWGYLAVEGGFILAPALGSRSTHVRSGLGGWRGRALRPDDAIPLAAPRASNRAEYLLMPRPATEPGLVRVLPGPQRDHFPEATLDRLCASPWRIGDLADRMGYRLEGPAIAALGGRAEIVSDGVVPGAIQVAGDGQPILLMADSQPTGGYPKLAVALVGDLSRAAQKRPGDTLRFNLVTAETALAARRAWLAAIDTVGARLSPLSIEPSAEALLAANLVGGVIDPLAEGEDAR